MKDISTQDIEQNLTLVCRKDFDRHIQAGKVLIGGKDLAIMAGPCTVESRSQIFEVAQAVRDAGATMLRGGVFKPLTFPYGDPLVQPDRDEYQGSLDRKTILKKPELFKAAQRRLAYFKEAGDKHGLPVVSEILYADSLKMMEPYVDMFQVGYRSMFNMDLILALCETSKPILLKRHYGESLRSLLGVAEHFEARGKHNFVFCERGVAAAHTHNLESRAVLDVQAVPALKEYAPTVPVIADPSHSTFKRHYVAPMARAAVAAGADGILIDIHSDPEKAWVDPLQALDFKSFKSLVVELKKIAQIVRGA
jgi:3-deoxy-7-phosphoheptulonate synthase